MKFTSIEEICKEFNIEYTEDINSIEKELNSILIEAHPDKNMDCQDEATEKFIRVQEAKEFLKDNLNNEIVTTSNILKLFNELKHIQLKENSKKTEEIVCEKSEAIVKSFKKYNLPKKITSATASVIVSFVWGIPSLIMEHPILGQIADNPYAYMVFTILWVYLLVLTGCFFWKLYREECFVKNILDELNNLDIQYEIFNDFIWSIELAEVEGFNKKELEMHIERRVFDKCIPDRRHRKIYKYIQEVIPSIASLIIEHALEKKIIKKKEKIHSWYDSYVVINELKIYNQL